MLTFARIIPNYYGGYTNNGGSLFAQHPRNSQSSVCHHRNRCQQVYIRISDNGSGL